MKKLLGVLVAAMVLASCGGENPLKASLVGDVEAMCKMHADKVPAEEVAAKMEELKTKYAAAADLLKEIETKVAECAAAAAKANEVIETPAVDSTATPAVDTTAKKEETKGGHH